MVGLCCYTWPFSSCDEQELLSSHGPGLLIAVPYLVSERGL